jgi:hypothetical protein
MGKLAFAVILMATVLGTIDVGQKNPPPHIRMPIVHEKNLRPRITKALGFILL